MNKQEIAEIVACLPKGKTPFYYFKDRYALMLLSYFVRNGMAMRDIKKSSYAKLLKKPILKKAVEAIGDGVVSSGTLESLWPPQPECYLLTLGEWGEKRSWFRSYYQTSRSGRNLVLQLNFSAKHNRPYYKLIQPTKKHPFEYDTHPIARKGYHTLAWARLDIEMENDEALIEEIQSDWVKLAVLGEATVESLAEREDGRMTVQQHYFSGLECDADALKAYVDDVLKPHMGIWEEAILAATIWFVKEELGINRIFYHTFKTGNFLKGITGRTPPKSLYTSLPKRFCFTETNAVPKLIAQGRNKRTAEAMKRGELRFFLLDLA